MKRVKDRAIYDTEQAEQIAEYAPITDPRDFSYLIERLYKTAEGEYFLHGQGGPGTLYGQRRYEGYIAGEEIRVLTEEQALDWCEERSIDGNIIIEEFSNLLV
jgi:hypothetical protein